MPALRLFRTTLITLSLGAFCVSVLFLVSSAPLEPGTMELATMEPARFDQTGMEPSKMEPVKLDQTGTEPAKLDQAKLDQSGTGPANPGLSVPRQTTPSQPATEPAAEAAAVEASILETPVIEASSGGPLPVRSTSASILDGNQILAFYGKPGASSMGILGEYPKEQLAPFLSAYAKLYDDANGELGVVPAFYLIYGTCWPGGEIGILRDSVVQEYIEFAADRGWLVFLDHQIGKYAVEQAVASMLPFLRYSNVHLAVDPEWRTLTPMQNIGHVTGEELNQAQAMVEAYLVEHSLPGRRMLVVHQFTSAMIRQRELVDTSFDRVTLVHTADGFGSPALKRYSYGHNAKATNIPVKGFKLFFESKVPGAGWDLPLMLPEEVLALEPLPLVIMYQ